ncbi:MAG: hypothetical protein M5U19_22480 [Microthrixaceae bacterium]|nr:hypothetical protein [Microthrixaceae bacterium]
MTKQDTATEPAQRKRLNADITKWDPEDEEFWESTGKHIANRNLWISIPSLLMGFAVWMYWSIITVQMLNLGFPSARPSCSRSQP